MRIVFAYYLALPFALIAAAVWFYAHQHDGVNSFWFVPFLVVCGLIFILSPQINWRWYSKHPPVLEPGVVKILEQAHPFYRSLDIVGKKRFRDRLALTRMATDWATNGMPEDNLPSDLQSAIAAQSVCVTWGKETFLFKAFEKVVVAPQPFFTPNYPFAHSTEHFIPDGCVLFSADRIMAAFMQPQQVFNVALYEYARVFRYTYPQDIDASTAALSAGWDWSKLEQVSGPSMTFDAISKVLLLPDVDDFAVAVHHYFTFNDRFKVVFPAESGWLDGLFGVK
jgi:hypothetical protein